MVELPSVTVTQDDAFFFIFGRAAAAVAWKCRCPWVAEA